MKDLQTERHFGFELNNLTSELSLKLERMRFICSELTDELNEKQNEEDFWRAVSAVRRATVRSDILFDYVLMIEDRIEQLAELIDRVREAEKAEQSA